MLVTDRRAAAERASAERAHDPISALQEMSDSELTERAAAGERRAAGELLARRMPMLAAVARRITLPIIDADDLLAEAITHLLARWATGSGPKDGVDAYLIRSMRNRVVDEVRSPRSRNTTIEFIPEPSEPEHAGFHRAELHRELALVQTALARLPANQRQVLQATVVDGRKPGDLVGELGPSSGAVSILRHRAKLGLQRALLQTILEDSHEVDCQQCARHLPKVVTAELLDEPTAASAHIKSCERCTTGWQRYLFLMSCGGVACLVLVGTLVVVPVVPASAAEPSSSTRDSSRDRPRIPQTRVWLGIVSVLAVAGVTCVAFGLPLDRIGSAAAQKPTASLTMSATSAGSGRTDLTMAFSMDRTPWTVSDATFVLPVGTALVSTPPGWSCHPTSPTGLACAVSGQDPRGGTFSFTSSPTGASTYQMVLHATSGNQRITATAQGSFPR